MSKFNKLQLINIFSALGVQLINPDENLLETIETEHHYNAWFTADSVLHAIKAIGVMLNEKDLGLWLDRYNLDENKPEKKVGLILAGNIPLVGFHDILCVLVTGNYALIKASSQDARLIKGILALLTTIEPHFKGQYSFVERLTGFDAVIATGSNNTSRYFEYYFGKVPSIIRKNRSSIAVLRGDETAEQLYQLGHDIFDYFGLGCRNVSKLLVPEGYNFNFFFESIEVYNNIINHNKYNNNYFYNKSIYLVNSDKHLDNNFLLLKEDIRLASPLGVLYFEYYDDLNAVKLKLTEDSDRIQCVVSAIPLEINNQVVDFGQSQQPALWDYADGVDTMQFLTTL
ncbi:acyl-CoA reductase [Mucilaginibacter sp.]|uniref:acyl-CoA reductase n=1 Tax=Mucilaginibacter sp. TaxID=1882438 RepID=UPI002851A5C7|nr:acyl-CoA reductase [Mucilaginibacter sp.]MDR3697500.1 acyl-CoA reductase [Mucilaginibacter sp.]